MSRPIPIDISLYQILESRINDHRKILESATLDQTTLRGAQAAIEDLEGMLKSRSRNEDDGIRPVGSALSGDLVVESNRSFLPIPFDDGLTLTAPRDLPSTSSSLRSRSSQVSQPLHLSESDAKYQARLERKRQKHNSNRRAAPSKKKSKLEHATEKAIENLEEVSVQIGHQDGSLEDSGLTSKAMWRGETKERRNTHKIIRAPEGEIEFIAFDPCHSSTRGLSKLGDVLFARAGPPPPGFLDQLNEFAKSVLDHPRLPRTINSKNTRSDDVEQFIIGTTRTYSMALGLTGSFNEHPELVEQILSDHRLHRVVTYINQLFKIHYPKVYERYRAANPGGTSPFRSRFGVFPQLCFNWSKSMRGAASKMHPDAKNPAGGVCCVISYGHFDSPSSFFLYFEELGKAIELPAGVPVFFPSALFLQGNINRPSVVEAKDANEVLEGRGIPRGSLVFFGQADWLSTTEAMAGVGGEDRKKGVYTGLGSIFRT